ncbi:MAG: methyl-accepting chemotaxis protein [Acidimicrobiaceae bacterium]|nr:methyl-accepting chemotaxis protein [Acidimicrobiaceae bacterium]
MAFGSPFRKARYRSRLVAGVLAASLPVTALTVAVLTSKASRELTRSTTAFLAARAKHVADDIELDIESRRQDVAFAASRLARLPAPEAPVLLSALMQQRGGFDEVEMVDLNGKVLAAGDPAGAFTAPPSDWFRRAVSGADSISPVYLDEGARDVRWVFAAAVAGPTGLPVAVVLADVQAGHLSTQLAHAEFARTAELQLVDGDGRLILRQTNTRTQRLVRTDADLLASGSLTTVLNTAAAAAAPHGTGTIRYREVSGRHAYGGYAPVPSVGWGLVVKEDVSEALSEVDQQRRLGGLLVAAGAVVLALFAYFFARREVRFLRGIVSESRAASEEVTANAADMSSASEQLASTTLEQTGTVTETSATMEELARSSTAIAATVQQVAAQAGETRDSLEEAARHIEASSERTLALSERVGQITGILDLINELADQTNLLAVNAAIEAARAGEAGRGFSVVADEVRRLAERSKASSADIAAIIASAQEESAGTVSAMETGARRMAHGMRLLEQVADGTAQVSLNTQQQGQATQQVVEAMDQLTDSSRQVATTAQQIAASAGTLAALASQLEQAAAAASARF